MCPRSANECFRTTILMPIPELASEGFLRCKLRNGHSWSWRRAIEPGLKRGNFQYVR